MGRPRRYPDDAARYRAYRARRRATKLAAPYLPRGADAQGGSRAPQNAAEATTSAPEGHSQGQPRAVACAFCGDPTNVMAVGFIVGWEVSLLVFLGGAI